MLTLDPQTGRVLGKWGADIFYMPHGLTVDRHDNLWVTDVALHQAFKVVFLFIQLSFYLGRIKPTNYGFFKVYLGTNKNKIF